MSKFWAEAFQAVNVAARRNRDPASPRRRLISDGAVDPARVGRVGQRTAQGARAFGRLPHQRGVVRRDGAVAQLQVVLEAYAHVAAESRRGRDAGVLLWSESADGPGQRMVAGGQEGQQIVGGRGLPRAVAAQNEQHRPGAGRRQSALAQRLPAAHVGLVVQDDLGQHAALGQPCQEGRQLAFRDLGHGDLAQADGDGLGRQFAHHRHLLGGAVDAGGLAGHLHQQLVAHRLAHGGQRVAIGLGVQQVASVRAAHVHVHHGRAGVQAGARLAAQRLGRQRHGGMVGGLLVGAVGRHGDDDGDSASGRRGACGLGSAAWVMAGSPAVRARSGPGRRAAAGRSARSAAMVSGVQA